MSWLINTALKIRSWGRVAFCALAALCLGAVAFAQLGELRPPTNAVAGNSASIAIEGGGNATFYLIGPGSNMKREIKLGQDVTLQPQETQAAGRYLAIVCADTCLSSYFFVAPGKPASIAFLVHPSRAPVGQNSIISGVAMPFDEFQNLILSPANVSFELAADGKSLGSHETPTHFGAAWFRSSSGRTAGTLQLTATINGVSMRRVVQQVASEPCNLRIKGQRNAKGVLVETDPVRDCAGNPVPDGTIVTFTAKDGDDTDTVDAPVKKGVARAQMIANGAVVISAASGVVMGNELHIAGGQ